MFHLYIFVLLAATVFAEDIRCKEGEKVSTQPIKNADYMIGNWSYVYHWGNYGERGLNAKADLYSLQNCPEIEIQAASPEFLKEKQADCAKYSVEFPFKWEDAKLKVVAPLMSIKDGIIAVGEKENWLMVECVRIVRVELKKASDDLMVWMNPQENVSEMLSRKPIKAGKVNCLARNLDVVKGRHGIAICY